MRHAILLILGWAFLLLGVLGLALPLLQGLLFLAIGIYLLSFEQPWFRARRAELERRFPDATQKLHEGEAWGRRLYRRVTGQTPEPDAGGNSRDPDSRR